MFRLQPITKVCLNLVMINALVFLSAEQFPDVFEQLVGYNPLHEKFRVWQPITHMFMHADFGHLFGNMLGVYFFGSLLEQVLGPKRFLFYYFSCGVIAWLIKELFVIIKFKLMTIGAPPEFIELAYKGMFNTQSSWSDSISLILNYNTRGASGAVFGLLVGFATFFPNMRLNLIFPPVSLIARQLAFFYGAFEYISLISNVPGDAVAHGIHLLGGLIGFFIIKTWKKQMQY